MDTIIIGAGPGGYELAAMLARKGERVTLIERGKLGGTCLNRGCIPTKVMAHAATLMRGASTEARKYGIEANVANVDMQALDTRRSEVVATLRQGVEGLMQGVEVIHGEARFVSAEMIEVTPTDYSFDEPILVKGDRFVIATGSEPATLPIPGAELTLNSDALLSLTTLPQSMAIIGGGVIGMEFASIFAALGVKVTVIEYCKEILPPFDRDIAKRLRTEMAKASGITFILGAQVTAVAKADDNHLAVNYTANGKELSVDAETVAMAVGRRPVFPEGLELTGVGFDRRGIKVDTNTFATSVPHIYAIGDVNGICMLAHAASAQAAVVAGENVDTQVIPSVVFTHPEAAMAGLTEQQCKDAAMAVRTAKVPFRGNGKAVTMDETSGLVKLIVEDTPDKANAKILGCHIMGPHAADLIMEVAPLIVAGTPLSHLTRTVHPHPTLSEALLAAARTLS